MKKSISLIGLILIFTACMAWVETANEKESRGRVIGIEGQRSGF